MPEPTKKTFEVKDLQNLIVLWDFVNANSCSDYTDAARKVWGDPKEPWRPVDTKNRVESIESHLGMRPFFQLREHTLVVNPAFEGVIEKLRPLLRFRRKDKERVGLRFGVGHSVSMSLAPVILDRIRNLDGVPIDVSLVIDDCDNLFRKMEYGDLDCLLAVFPSDFPFQRVQPKHHSDWPIEPAVIARLSHPVARAFRALGVSSNRFFDFNLLADQTIGVHVLDNAAIRHASKLFEAFPKVRCFSQPTYAAINELVANGSDLGVTLPQFLTKSQALNIQVMPLKVTDKPLLRLIRCDALHSGNYGDEFQNALDRLADISQKTIDAHLCSQDHSDDDVGITRSIYIQLPIPINAGKIGNGAELRWVQGEFSVFAKWESSFTGELRLQKAMKVGRNPGYAYERVFSIKGNIQRNRDDAWNELVIFRGRDETGNRQIKKHSVSVPIGEIFTGSFIRGNGSDTFQGLWLGWESELAIPTTGNIVIASKEQKLKSASLDRLIKQDQNLTSDTLNQ